MLTSQKVIDAINEQIGYEFSAELQYYAIAAHFAAEALPQLSQHFFQQAGRERACTALHQIRGRCRRTRRDTGDRRAEIEFQDPKGRGKTFARSGNSRHAANQRSGGTGPERERLYHDQLPAVVPDRAARGSLVDG